MSALIPSPSSSSSYALGIIFLVIVSVLWTACSMVVQHLYNDMSFDSPFLIVYIGTSLFSVFLPIRLGYEKWGHTCLTRLRRWRRRRNRFRLGVGGEVMIHKNDRGGYYEEDIDQNDVEEEEEEVAIIPWRNHQGAGDWGEVAELMSATAPSRNVKNGSRALEISDDPDDDCHDEATTDDEDYDKGIIVDGISGASPQPLLSHLDHLSMSSRLAPIWFFSNYSYAVSLRWTSIASSTVLASMGSIFAFGFATCTRFGDERVTRWKVLGVALCFAGGAATAWTDVGASSTLDRGGGGGDEGMHYRLRYLLMRSGFGRQLRHIADVVDDDSTVRSLIGDIAGLLSAMGYGAYTVLLRHLCPKDEDRMSMQLLFGYVGLLNMIFLSPVAVWVIVASGGDDDDVGDPASATATTTLTWTILLFLILKGLLDNVISDYLWARAVILTSATVASVGLGLTIPMAFFADWITGNPDVERHLGDVLGAMCVLFGFVFVNIGGEEKGAEEADVESETDVGSFDVGSAVHDAENRPIIIS